MPALKSSHLKNADHDGNKLRVTFHNGKVYEYNGVSLDDYNRLITAKSKGKHFRDNILGKFKCEACEIE